MMQKMEYLPRLLKLNLLLLVKLQALFLLIHLLCRTTSQVLYVKFSVKHCLIKDKKLITLLVFVAMVLATMASSTGSQATVGHRTGAKKAFLE